MKKKIIIALSILVGLVLAYFIITQWGKNKLPVNNMEYNPDSEIDLSEQWDENVDLLNWYSPLSEEEISKAKENVWGKMLDDYEKSQDFLKEQESKQQIEAKKVQEWLVVDEVNQTTNEESTQN